MTTLDINKATQPYEYYLKFIKQNVRSDCRKLSDIRTCNISFNCIDTVNGSAMVKLGATNVICGISARVCKPRVETPNKGFIICNVELPALCSQKNFKNLSTSSSFSQSSLAAVSIEQSQAMLTQLMQDVIAESKCVKEEDLCIKEGHLVWALYIDMICLNNDGNVQDTCWLALISALKTLKLYEMDYDENEMKPTIKYPLVYKPLQLYSIPVCTTLFALEDKILLSDPNKQEEEFMRTFVFICTLDDERICLLKKFGGSSLAPEQIDLCIDRALNNGAHLRKNVNHLYEKISNKDI